MKRRNLLWYLSCMIWLVWIFIGTDLVFKVSVMGTCVYFLVTYAYEVKET